MEFIGEALRLIRVFHDTKLVHLASKIGESQSYLSEIETGKKTATVAIVNEYAHYFGVKTWVIIQFAERVKDVQAIIKVTDSEYKGIAYKRNVFVEFYETIIKQSQQEKSK